MKEVIEKQEVIKEPEDNRKFKHWDQIIPKLNTIFVTANLGEGKTAFCFHLLDILKAKMPVYVLKHPDRKLIIERGYKNMYEIDEIEGLNNIALYVDEPQLIFPQEISKNKILLNKFFSLVRQKDIIFILSTSDTRYITQANDFYISTYIIKRIDYEMVKRGSKIKNIIREIAKLTPVGLMETLSKNEYLFYNKQFKRYNGRYTFKLPSYFDEKHSKPFR